MTSVIVEFIGSGYEVVKSVKVDATSFSDAFAKAEKWYEESNKTFDFCEMEIRDWRFVQF